MIGYKDLATLVVAAHAVGIEHASQVAERPTDADADAFPPERVGVLVWRPHPDGSGGLVYIDLPAGPQAGDKAVADVFAGIVDGRPVCTLRWHLGATQLAYTNPEEP